MAVDTRFELQVEDRDGLMLERALRGLIRVLGDRPPSGAIATIHDTVLPTASPVIDYQATDDFGIARIRLHVDIQSKHDTDDGSSVDDQMRVKSILDIPFRSENAARSRLPLSGGFPLDLSAFDLVAGDQLEMSLEVIDYRGPGRGETFRTPPLRMDIADEATVLSSITKFDEETEQRLSAIIERQLEVGRDR